MKARPYRSFEEFESALKNSEVPYESNEKLEEKLHNALTAVRRRGWSKKAVMLSLGLCLILVMGTAAMAARVVLQLHNKDGEIVFKYSQTSESRVEKDAKVRGIWARYKAEMKEVENELGPGEYALFLAPEAYEVDRYYQVLMNKAVYNDPKELANATVTNFIAPTHIPDDLSFMQGSISYETDPMELSELDALYEEAKSKNKEYIVKKGRLTEESRRINLEYGTDQFPHMLHLYIYKSEGIMSSISPDALEVINIDGHEALYYRDGNRLTFGINIGGENYAYELAGMMPQEQWISKEELVETARSILQQNNEH
ncbi:hypothetical protein [Paenibacillus thermotolerans]|uniref:hypothetical protein n=1 Tax=Paenibacillus thermotolerans TaxID=3027807 RepID=UPI00236768D9|nr:MULTISPECIES: hypothetical protein [unclassified Paenibacillus]